MYLSLKGFDSRFYKSGNFEKFNDIIGLYPDLKIDYNFYINRKKTNDPFYPDRYSLDSMVQMSKASSYSVTLSTLKELYRYFLNPDLYSGYKNVIYSPKIDEEALEMINVGLIQNPELSDQFVITDELHIRVDAGFVGYTHVMGDSKRKGYTISQSVLASDLANVDFSRLNITWIELDAPRNASGDIDLLQLLEVVSIYKEYYPN